MNQDKYVFSQIIEFLPRYELDTCVKRYVGNKRIKKWIVAISFFL